jgi:hypothetical protein
MVLVEIVQTCAGLRVLPGKDHECLWLAAWKALGGVARGAEIVQA